MNIRLAVVSLWAENVHLTAQFYRDVIGLPLSHHPVFRPHFDLGDGYLVILEGKPMSVEQAQRFPVIAFAVDNLEAAIEKLTSHQVELPWGIETDSHSSWVMFYDPAGNLIELVAFKDKIETSEWGTH